MRPQSNNILPLIILIALSVGVFLWLSQDTTEETKALQTTKLRPTPASVNSQDVNQPTESTPPESKPALTASNNINAQYDGVLSPELAAYFDESETYRPTDPDEQQEHITKSLADLDQRPSNRQHSMNPIGDIVYSDFNPKPFSPKAENESFQWTGEDGLIDDNASYYAVNDVQADQLIKAKPFVKQRQMVYVKDSASLLDTHKLIMNAYNETSQITLPGLDGSEYEVQIDSISRNQDEGAAFILGHLKDQADSEVAITLAQHPLAQQHTNVGNLSDVSFDIQFKAPNNTPQHIRASSLTESTLVIEQLDVDAINTFNSEKRQVNDVVNE